VSDGGIQTIVRWRGNAKIVRFEDGRLAASVERLQAEEPPRLAWVNLDAPPGTYEVESRTTMRGGCWEVRLDPNTGLHVGHHNCPYRAERQRENYPCIHIAAAWVLWKAQRDDEQPFLQKLYAEQERLAMAEQGTSMALAPYQGGQMAGYHVPSREEIGNTLSLAKVLYETRGAQIPESIKNVQQAAAVIMAGRELGFDPMTSFRRIYMVNGQTQLDAQGITAKIQDAGGNLIFHCDCDACADIELVRPGRPNLRIKYTMEQARKAGSNMGKYGEKAPWKAHPADMLVWKAITRLGKRGAADIVNAIEGSMVRVADFGDADLQLVPEDAQEAAYDRPALTGSGEVIDTETGEVLEDDDLPSDWPEDEAEAAVAEEPENTPDAPVQEPWQAVPYAAAVADKTRFFQELSAYQKALGRRLRPDGYEALTLGDIVAQSAARQ
jgi:hypothetical protein